MTLIPLDRKVNILEDAKERILKNHTLKQVAKTHDITKRTLNSWLMSLGDEYQELRQLCIDVMLAEAFFGEPIEQAVVTVPAYFDDNQCSATKDACRIAEIKVARLVNEPTAALLAYIN